ncbi:MAG: hypothetical protein AAGF78_04355 [Pseudomonadota bacterium]
MLTYLDLETQGHLLEPFVRHYTSLGVASRMISTALGVKAITPAHKQMVIDLKASGIRAPKLVSNTLDADGMAHALLQIQKKTMAPGEWVLRAEIDELLDMPLPLAHLLEKIERFGFDWMPHYQSGKVMLHSTSMVVSPDKATPALDETAALARRHIKAQALDDKGHQHRKAQRLFRLRDETPARMPYPGGGKTRATSRVSRAVAAEGWTVRQLTPGAHGDAWHAHSYYDIPVVDPKSLSIAAYRSDVPYRPVTPTDTVQIGRVSVASGGFEPLAETLAWSWQQGPMAQWTQTGDLLWNDRVEDTLVGRRLKGGEPGSPETFDRPIYALTPDGTGYLSVCWARLARFRPAYGYEGGSEASAGQNIPKDDGIWHVDFATGQSKLVLSVAEAVACLFDGLTADEVREHRTQDFGYWFNHVKISPDGKRFTAKLRYKTPDTPFQGVSITCGMDGTDVHLLAKRTSHVIWIDAKTLFWWSMTDKEVMIGSDTPLGQGDIRPIAKGAFTKNPHAQLWPGTKGRQIIFDVPYRRTVDLKMLDRDTQVATKIAQFGGHLPDAGTYRCDLHAVPLPDGRGAVVTSLASGSRQVWVVEHGGA